MKVVFYHFTSKYHLELIRKSGYISPISDIPITPTGGFKAICLTSDNKPENQHWVKGSIVNKSEVCLEVKLDPGNPGLAYFLEVAAIFNMTGEWLSALGKGHEKNWWIYTDLIKFDESMVKK